MHSLEAVIQHGEQSGKRDEVSVNNPCQSANDGLMFLFESIKYTTRGFDTFMCNC